MSNYSQVLSEIVDKNALKKKKIAKRSRLRKKVITRILSGKKKNISNGQFKRLARAVTRDELDQAHLLAARMMDLCQGPGKDLVSVQVKGETDKNNSSE